MSERDFKDFLVDLIEKMKIVYCLVSGDNEYFNWMISLKIAELMKNHYDEANETNLRILLYTSDEYSRTGDNDIYDNDILLVEIPKSIPNGIMGFLDDKSKKKEHLICNSSGDVPEKEGRFDFYCEFHLSDENNTSIICKVNQWGKTWSCYFSYPNEDLIQKYHNYKRRTLGILT